MVSVVTGIFLGLIGLTVGSFLNVVIYRLLAGMSVASPRRSFCPSCRRTLTWYENIPVLSWLVLRGRCRTCRAPISAQYPIVEAACGLAFVLVYRMLEQGMHLRVAPFELPADLGVLAAWLVLVVVMIACAGMDLAAFVIDTRVTALGVIAGLLAGLFATREAMSTQIAITPLAAMTLTVGILSVARLMTAAAPGDPPLPPAGDEQAAEPARLPTDFVSGAFLAVVLLGLTVLQALLPIFSSTEPAVLLWASLAVLLLVIVLAAGQPREVDAEIHAAISAEEAAARPTAVRELIWLAPMVLAGLVVGVLVTVVTPLREGWSAAMGWQPVAGVYPLAGMCFAIHGAVLAAAAGWVIRLVFTLALGREAFATGDIFILAAGGALIGWELALLGFLLAVLLALVGWLLGLLLKRTGMIPFGPWLGLGFLTALAVHRPAAAYAQRTLEDIRALAQQRPEMLVLLVGILLVGSVAATVLARLLRRFIEPMDSPAAADGLRGRD